MRIWESGELDEQDCIHVFCNKFVANTEYKFCRGLDPEEYTYQKNILRESCFTLRVFVKQLYSLFH